MFPRLTKSRGGMGLFRRAVKKVVREPLHSPFPNSINRMASYAGPVRKLNESRTTAAIVNFIVNIKVKYPRTTLIDAYNLIESRFGHSLSIPMLKMEIMTKTGYNWNELPESIPKERARRARRARTNILRRRRSASRVVW